MSKIEIVKYDHSFAQELADMWNKSGKNWGGEEVVKTAEDIINENDNMGNICAFIALDGKEVVGYCSFGEYKQDEGASYIPLLNVRPDYLGRKIGKKLLLECVNMAIGAKWPRLDLYTWQGNDKAVPLYKKCGFFWERRDDTTHLMNFIPYVMRTEAVKGYFEKLDWYKDSIREIRVESDGRTDGDFDYYDYQWKNADINLRMEFERKGRGLTCIETDDYLIRARVNKQKLVFGRKYKIHYEIKNKSQKPLQVSIKSQDDKNIKFDFKYEKTITDCENVTGEFYVDSIDEDQSIWKTHPCAAAVIKINGKEALFKVGINPKFPVKLTMHNSNNPMLIGKKSKCYVDVQNNFDEAIAVEFKLPDSDFVTFDNQTVKCNIKAEGKEAIDLNCMLTKYGFYDKEVVIQITTTKGKIEFKNRITGAFRGYSGKFYGMDEEGWYTYNGLYSIQLRKLGNSVIIDHLEYDFNELSVRPPKIGKPYSLEFFNKQPKNVHFEVNHESVLLKAYYQSDSFKGIELEYVVELYQNGITHMYYNLKNTSKNTVSDVYVNQPIFNLINNGYIPMDGKVIRSPGADGLIANRWNYNKIDQNWVFCDTDATLGIGWSSDSSMTFENVFIVVENSFGNIEPGEEVKSKPMVIAYNSFSKWQEFSHYMGNETKQNTLKEIKQGFECNLNNGNPFVDDKMNVALIENQKIPVEKGVVRLHSDSGWFDDINKPLEFKNNNCSLDIDLKEQRDIDIVKVEADILYRMIKREKVIFYQGKNQIIRDKSMEQDKEVFIADNGVLRIKASPEYSIGIFSLEHKENQWLSNSFPTPAIKGWWNYWTGGMGYKPVELTFASIQKECRRAEFVNVMDNHGNNWSGIKTTLDIIENEKYKGLKIDQYFLMLPNVPVLCNIAVIRQNTGKFLSSESFNNDMFIQGGDNLEKNWVRFNENKGEEIIYKCVESEFDILSNTCMIHGIEGSSYKMTRLYNEGKPAMFYNTNGVAWGRMMNEITAPDNSITYVNPSFIVFSEQELNHILLEDLNKLSFNVE